MKSAGMILASAFFFTSEDYDDILFLLLYHRTKSCSTLDIVNEISKFVYDKRRRELMLDRLALSAIIFFAYYKL